MKYLDKIIDSVTMYRLVLYYLIALLIIAGLFGFFKILPYSPIAIAVSCIVLISVSWATNKLFSSVFRVPVNVESVYITALILALIITPMKTMEDSILLAWAAVLANASKYIFAIYKKHIFNPAALAVVLTAFCLGQSASWWVGNTWMSIFVLVGGILLVRKINREDLVISFFVAALISVSVFMVLKGGNVITTYEGSFFHSSLLFLGFVMLTEPLTTPPTRPLRIIYGALVGLLFSPKINVYGIYSTPELALLTGNIFSYLVSSKQKLVLAVQQKIQIAPDLVDFLFIHDKKFHYIPGQYMEWTLPPEYADDRGNRRYFTLASSPTEDSLRLGVKFCSPGSSYKEIMAAMDATTPIIASQLSGDFTLPRNKQKKLVFIAGGIGITPFRSMMKSLVDTNERRDIVLFYSNRHVDEVVYTEVFDAAVTNLGIRTVYTLTDTTAIPPDWQFGVGRIDETMIAQEVPDYLERFFYLSGSHDMVTAYEATLRKMGVKRRQIKKDYFPGYA